MLPPAVVSVGGSRITGEFFALAARDEADKWGLVRVWRCIFLAQSNAPEHPGGFYFGFETFRCRRKQELPNIGYEFRKCNNARCDSELSARVSVYDSAPFLV